MFDVILCVLQRYLCVWRNTVYVTEVPVCSHLNRFPCAWHTAVCVREVPVCSHLNRFLCVWHNTVCVTEVPVCSPLNRFLCVCCTAVCVPEVPVCSHRDRFLCVWRFTWQGTSAGPEAGGSLLQDQPPGPGLWGVRHLFSCFGLCLVSLGQGRWRFFCFIIRTMENSGTIYSSAVYQLQWAQCTNKNHVPPQNSQLKDQKEKGGEKKEVKWTHTQNLTWSTLCNSSKQYHWSAHTQLTYMCMLCFLLEVCIPLLALVMHVVLCVRSVHTSTGSSHACCALCWKCVYLQSCMHMLCAESV